MEKLPDHIFIEIFKYSGGYCNLSLVCKRWNNLISSSAIMKEITYSCDRKRMFNAAEFFGQLKKAGARKYQTIKIQNACLVQEKNALLSEAFMNQPFVRKLVLMDVSIPVTSFLCMMEKLHSLEELETVDITVKDSLFDDQIVPVSLPSLKSFEFFGDFAFLRCIGDTNVQKFKLTQYKNINMLQLKGFLDAHRTIEDLTLYIVDDDGFLHAFNGYVNQFKSLDISFEAYEPEEVEDEVLMILKNNKESLKHLRVNPLSPAVLDFVFRMPLLESLRLDYNVEPHANTICESNLKKLSIGHFYMEVAVFHQLFKICRHVEELTLENDYEIDQIDKSELYLEAKRQNKIVQWATTILTKLKRLTLENGMVELLSSDTLEYLNITMFENNRFVLKARNLKTFIIQWFDVDFSHATIFCETPNLQHLEIEARCEISTEFLDTLIANCPKLRTLKIVLYREDKEVLAEYKENKLRVIPRKFTGASCDECDVLFFN